MSLPPDASDSLAPSGLGSDTSLHASEAAADLAAVVRRLVDIPAEVHVDGMSGRDGLLLEASVAPADTGKVIGREGRTIQALRTLLDARGDAQGERYELDLLDD